MIGSNLHVTAKAHALSEHFESIQSCINSIRTTNSFMLMTINRCIDYTKASKGLKLVPILETLNLRETIQLPLSCVQSMQQRIKIACNPIPEEICSHVITDKQWLQENILCLLSNAVKYSAEGIVTINVLLDDFIYNEEDDDDEDGDHQENRDDQTELADAITVGGRTSNTMISSRSYGGGSNSIRSRNGGNHSHRLVLPSSTASFRSRATVSYYSHGANSRAMSTRDGHLMPFIRVEVEDTGIGMSEEAMANLFSPFKQNQRLAGGTGLGLYSLAKRLEALHGYYGVMKRRDGKEGSLFWFAIPYKPDMVLASLTAQLEELPTSNKETGSSGGVSLNRHLIPDGIDSTTINASGSFKDLTDQSTPKPFSDMPIKPITSRNGNVVTYDPPIQRSQSMMSTGDDDDTETTAVAATIACLTRASWLSNTDSDATSMQASVLPFNAIPAAKEKDGKPKMSILLVDDSPTIVKMSMLILKKLGHKVEVAENGALAVKMIDERLRAMQAHFIETATEFDASSSVLRCFDVILMDLQMPVMDGLEATRRIRAIEDDLLDNDHLTVKHIIVGMSANSDDVTTTCALEAGVDMFLPKPFTLESINSTLVDIFPTL